MTLPPEIVERILLNCDGKTLLCARRVSKQWGTIVEYVSEKTCIWKWCCHEEIPEKELIQYLENYDKSDSTIWFYIYKNWVTWQDIPGISFDVLLSPAEIPRITCIDVFENYIAVGSEDGRVRIFDHYWKPLNITRHQAEKVSKVAFLHNGSPASVLKVVVAYPKAVIIDDVYGDGYNHLLIEDALNPSTHRNYICYQKPGGRLTIEKLSCRIAHRLLEEIWFTRIYSPDNITCLNIWNGICTVLINKDVRAICYDSKNVQPISNIPKRCLLNFSSPSNSMTSQQVHFILRDDIIIVLYRAENLLSDKEYMEVIMLGKGSKYVKKLFNTSDVLDGSITCICLYGNTFILGVDTGIVYFYHLPSWKHFSLKDYQKRVIIGKHPITNIVVQERKDKRKFFITSSFNIHQVVGFSSYF